MPKKSKLMALFGFTGTLLFSDMKLCLSVLSPSPGNTISTPLSVFTSGMRKMVSRRISSAVMLRRR